MKVNFMESGHWVDAGCEWGWRQAGRKGDEDDSRFLHWALL